MDSIHKSINYHKEITLQGSYDVAVCGGGCAGFTAALQASRLGARTCVIEKTNMPGGVLTSGRNNEIALFNAGETPVVRGIGWEYIKRLEAMGYARIPEFKSGVRHSQQGVHVNIPMAAFLMETMWEEAAVDTFYMTTLTDMIRQEEGWLIITADKGGLHAIQARRVVDCTGDGDACFFAGAEYELGDEATGALQPGTLGFFVDVSGAENLKHEKVGEVYRKSLEDGSLKHGDIWSTGATPFHAILNKGNNINHVGVGVDYQENRTQIEKEGRKSIARLAEWFKKHFPELGETEIEICGVAGEVALRETRRVVCDKRITVEDYAGGRKYEDGVSQSYYPIDLHKHNEKDGTLYNIYLDEKTIPAIPYGAMLPKGLTDILVAGRCISGDRLAQSAYRVKASCMGMGQAAGAAAALSALKGRDLRALDLNELKTVLKEHGALLP